MIKHLKTHLRHPLEREYEAWIIDAIEQYFESVNIKTHIFAISPDEERFYPVDEISAFNGKIVGLQFKRNVMADGDISSNRLHWNFYSPSYQMTNLLKFEEIYYCLPTFVNRKFRKSSLDHCLFWRPDNDTKKTAWFDNSKSDKTKSYQSIKNAMRWGLLVEEILNCNIGKKIARNGIEDYLFSVTNPDTGIKGLTYFLLMEF